MSINRDYWQNSFKKGEFPHWNCPVCKKSFLTLINNGIKEYETADSINSRNDDDWYFLYVKEIFIGILKCNNENCNQIFTINGDVNIGVEYEDNKSTEPKEFREYYPININPHINIFEIHFDTPIDVEIEISKAFKLFWLDKSSCGNQIRKVVEAIMNDKNIRKTKPSNRKVKFSLHQRIHIFKEKYEDIADTLLAIKWIGNHGSHLGDIENEDLLDGIELLEEALNNLYNTEKKRLHGIQKTILKKHE